MRTRTLLIVLMLILIAAFVAINWPAVVAPTTLSLLFASFEAPIGLVLLGILLFVVLAFASYMALWQGTILMETRRNAKELQQQRTLAEQVEASRFSELRTALHDELERLAQRVAQTGESLHNEIRDQGNSLAAAIAEMDDRIGRRAG